jgi:uncharacterized protein YodC (DUF2158 family)
MSIAFESGALVTLRSGGPTMTVDSIGTWGQVVCVWFVGMEVRRAGFAAPTLIHCEEEVPF